MAALWRTKCPVCGQAVDVTGNNPCPKCGSNFTLPSDGFIQIYRMGSPLGIAAGFGIYINNVPIGYVANKQTIKIPVNFGTYNIHITCGMTRRCEDITVQITENNRFSYIKARIKPGFLTNTIICENSSANDMPQI